MKKHGKRNTIPRKTAYITFAAVVFLCAAISLNTYREARSREALLEENRKRIQTLSKDIKQTGTEIRNSDTAEFAEKVAREDLGMVKPREVIYIDKDRDRDNSRDKNIEEDRK